MSKPDKPTKTPSLSSDNNDKHSDDTSDHPNTDNVNEYGGPKGEEPTRFGDWERNGICKDF